MAAERPLKLAATFALFALHQRSQIGMAAERPLDVLPWQRSSSLFPFRIRLAAARRTARSCHLPTRFYEPRLNDSDHQEFDRVSFFLTGGNTYSSVVNETNVLAVGAIDVVECFHQLQSA